MLKQYLDAYQYQYDTSGDCGLIFEFAAALVSDDDAADADHKCCKPDNRD